MIIHTVLYFLPAVKSAYKSCMEIIIPYHCPLFYIITRKQGYYKIGSLMLTLEKKRDTFCF